MAQHSLEIVRGALAAFGERDIDAVLASLDPEVEWEPAGPAAVERAVYRGREEIRDAILGVWEVWEVIRFHERQMHDLGESVLWLGRAELRGSSSHVALEQEFANLCLLRERKLARIKAFLSWQQALLAAGVSETAH